MEVAGKSLPVLTNLDKGRYGVIVFENFNKYLQMDNWNRELLDKYCREYLVGIIGFINPGEETLVGAQLKGFPLFMHTNLRLKVRIVFFYILISCGIARIICNVNDTRKYILSYCKRLQTFIFY